MRWFLVDVLGLFSIIVVSFSINLVLGDRIFSINLVPKQRMFSVPAIYVLSPLHLDHGTGKISGQSFFPIFRGCRSRFWGFGGVAPNSKWLCRRHSFCLFLSGADFFENGPFSKVFHRSGRITTGYKTNGKELQEEWLEASPAVGWRGLSLTNCTLIKSIW